MKNTKREASKHIVHIVLCTITVCYFLEEEGTCGKFREPAGWAANAETSTDDFTETSLNHVKDKRLTLTGVP